jgi:hypothetical protein
MRNVALSGPVANYVAAANAQDIEAVTASFGEEAVVHDERAQRTGTAAIREWATEVSRKYRPTVEALDISQSQGRTILTGRVSGDFPGSPIQLRYAFTLAGNRIQRLDIDPVSR